VVPRQDYVQQIAIFERQSQPFRVATKGRSNEAAEKKQARCVAHFKVNTIPR